MLKLRQEMIDIMMSACDEAATLNTAQMKDLLKLAVLAVRQTRRVVPQSENISMIWEPNAWDKLRTKLRSTERFKSSTALHALCEQTIQTIQVTASPMRTKGPKIDAKFETPSGKRKKEVKGTEPEEEEEVTPKLTKRKKVKKDKI
jgi:DNA polymerase phi